MPECAAGMLLTSKLALLVAMIPQTGQKWAAGDEKLPPLTSL